MRSVRAIDPLGRAPSSSPPVLRSTRRGGGGHTAPRPATIPVSPFSASLARSLSRWLSLHPFPLPLFRRRRRRSRRRRHRRHRHGARRLFCPAAVLGRSFRRRLFAAARVVVVPAPPKHRCAHDDGDVVC